MTSPSSNLDVVLAESTRRAHELLDNAEKTRDLALGILASIAKVREMSEKTASSVDRVAVARNSINRSKV